MRVDTNVRMYNSCCSEGKARSLATSSSGLVGTSGRGIGLEPFAEICVFVVDIDSLLSWNYLMLVFRAVLCCFEVLASNCHAGQHSTVRASLTLTSAAAGQGSAPRRIACFSKLAIFPSKTSIMAASSRGLSLVNRFPDFVCSRCLLFSTSSLLQSGHSRWSKIKHDKGAVDAKKNAKRTAFAHELTLASKRTSIPPSTLGCYHSKNCAVLGPDPGTNNRLAAAIASAKKGI